MTLLGVPEPYGRPQQPSGVFFHRQKKKGKKARFVEGKVDRKTQTSDDTDAYDLIMRDKERLLSLDAPWMQGCLRDRS